MTDIRKILFFKHLRSESNMHIRRFRRGRLIASGKGLAFWFLPMGASIAELPTDDRELQFIFKGRLECVNRVSYAASTPGSSPNRVRRSHWRRFTANQVWYTA